MGFDKHDEMTAFGTHSSKIDTLSEDISILMEVVRGIFVHCDYLKIYKLSESVLETCSRETLSCEKRLDRIYLTCNNPIDIVRPPKYREVVTCRDYALMICGMLRQKSVPARVRCGFARYFSPEKFEDHWVCECWLAHEKRWARIDAQLDEQQRDHLNIDFDTRDLPDGLFVTANEAWGLIRKGKFEPHIFGHGDTVGEWFAWINLARDYLSLQGQLVSRWDNWRNAINTHPVISHTDRATGDKIAISIRSLEEGRPFDSVDTFAIPIFRRLNL